MAYRRVRGAILRLVRRRGLSMAIGVLLIAPSAWVEFSGRYSSGMQGGALIAGATGLALFWTGLTGLSPDWVE